MEFKDFSAYVALILSLINFFIARNESKKTKQLSYEVKRQEILNLKIQIQAERLAIIETLKDCKQELLKQKQSIFLVEMHASKIDAKIHEISMQHYIKSAAESVHSPKLNLLITHQKMLEIENELGEAKRAIECQRQENLKINDFIRDIKIKANI